MKILELFSGSRSFSKVAEEFGHDVFCVDIKQFPYTDYIVDVLDFDFAKVPFIPDIIWASPPCTTFSIASCYHHWTKERQPKTDAAKNGIEIVKKTLEILKHFNPKYFYIENPRGLLRKMDFMQTEGIRHTVTYCQYGDKRMKPTDIWTNNFNWIPKPMCKNGMPCHESAPRGSKTGTQGLKDSFERSKVPYELCKEILKSL
jgi:site-specific DNA-cytosine methylase